MYEFQAGATSVSIDVNLVKASDGTPFTGLTFATAGLLASYHRIGSAAVAITLATQTVGAAWATGGFVEVEATKFPGLYRLDIPNAALVAGVKYLEIGFAGSGAGAVRPVFAGIKLSVQDPHDIVASILAGATAAPIAADVKKINATTVNGNGAGTPWGP